MIHETRMRLTNISCNDRESLESEKAAQDELVSIGSWHPMGFRGRRRNIEIEADKSIS